MSNDFNAKLMAIIDQLDLNFRIQGQRDIKSVLQMGVSSYNDLLTVLQDQDVITDVRATICWVLARLGDERAVPVLLLLLEDEIPDLRAAAAKSLGELASKQAVRPLIATMLGDKDVEVRKSAAYALGLLRDKRAVKPLISILTNQTESPRVRGMVAEALSDLKDNRAVVPLIAALRDSQVEVRFWAAFALGELGEPQALPQLERLAALDETILPGWWAVNEEATRAIQRIQDRWM